MKRLWFLAPLVALLLIATTFTFVYAPMGVAAAPATVLTTAQKATVTTAATTLTEQQFLAMTPMQLAQMHVDGVTVGTGPTVASGATSAGTAQAQAVYASTSAASASIGASYLMPDIEKMPVSTIAAFQSVYQDPSAPFSAVYTATLSVIATAASLGIAGPFYSQTMWWAIGGVACGIAVVAIGLIVLAILGSVVTLGLSDLALLVLVGVAISAGAACVIATASLLGWFNTVTTVYAQQAYNEGSMNKSVSGFENGITSADTQANQFFAELPFMQYTLYRLSDMQALSQIGNSTFNPVQNLYDSGILQGFADSQFVALIGTLNEQLHAVSAQANALTIGGHSADSFQWNTVPLSNNTDVFGVSGGPLYVNAADNNSELLVDYSNPGGSTVSCTNGGGGPVSLPSLSAVAGTSQGWAVNSNTASTCRANNTGAIESFAGDYGGSAVINGTGGVGGSGTGNGMGGSAGVLLATDGVPFCPTSGYCPEAGAGSQYTVFPARGVGTNGGSLAGFHDALTGYTVNTTLVDTKLVTTAYNDFAALEYNAVANGKVYWQFLRSQNITNPNDVPTEYILVTPAQLLSDGVCIDNVSMYAGTHYKGPCANLNYNETYSLYLAWLYDLNVFNATTYHEAQPVSCGSAGSCTFWGNINLYGFGDVYIPGAYPQNETYAAAHCSGEERFSNTGCWAMVNTQLLFFPQLLDPDNFSTAYNNTWNVPVSAPLAVYGTSDHLFEPLFGNGTANGTLIAGDGQAAAIRLSYCDLYQKNVSAGSGLCVAYPYTVNYTIGVLVCGANTQSCFTTPPTSTVNSCWDIFDLSGYMGFAGGFACALAWLADIIIVLVLVAIIAAVYRGFFPKNKYH